MGYFQEVPFLASQYENVYDSFMAAYQSSIVGKGYHEDAINERLRRLARHGM